jgi:hypothetical protein
MREETSSITHLVKIVAEEVVMEVLEREGLTNRPWETGFITGILNTVKSTAKEHLENVSSSVERAGFTWDAAEKEMFNQEITTAVAQIAKNHQRTMGAIRAALKKAIIEGDF